MTTKPHDHKKTKISPPRLNPKKVFPHLRQPHQRGKSQERVKNPPAQKDTSPMFNEAKVKGIVCLHPRIYTNGDKTPFACVFVETEFPMQDNKMRKYRTKLNVFGPLADYADGLKIGDVIEAQGRVDHRWGRCTSNGIYINEAFGYVTLVERQSQKVVAK